MATKEYEVPKVNLRIVDSASSSQVRIVDMPCYAEQLLQLCELQNQSWIGAELRGVDSEGRLAGRFTLATPELRQRQSDQISRGCVSARAKLFVTQYCGADIAYVFEDLSLHF